MLFCYKARGCRIPECDSPVYRIIILIFYRKQNYREAKAIGKIIGLIVFSLAAQHFCYFDYLVSEILTIAVAAENLIEDFSVF